MVRPFFVALDEGRFTAATSTLTLVETLIHPLRNGRVDLVNRYQDILLNAQNLVTYDLSPEIAILTARVRATHDLRTPDAIQLATAIHAGASFFLSNDRALRSFPLLNVLLMDDLAQT